MSRLDLPRRLPVVLLLVAGVAAVALSSWLRFDYFSDDAFITLRYVRNLVEGHGYVYNPGERVEGATNLLWALLLAPAGWLHLDLVGSARALGLFCAGAAAALAGREAWRRRGWIAALAVILLAACQPDFACWAGAGLEGPLVALLGMLVVQAPAQARWGVFAGLAFATRPDGVLVAAAALPARLRPPRALAALVTIVLAVTLFRWTYFHRLVPNTAAKISLSPHQLSLGFSYVRSFPVGSGSTLLLLLAGLGVWTWRRDPAVRGGAAWVVAQTLFCVLVGGDGLAMYRFFVPLVPVLAFLAVLGAEALAARLPNARHMVLASVSLITAFPLLLSDGGARSPQTQRDVEIPRWEKAGRWLAAHSQRTDVVAAAPIGTVGYYSDRPILDLLGLTDAHIAKAPVDPTIDRPGHQRHDGRYVLDQKPAFLLLGNVDVSPGQALPVPFAWERDINADPRLRRDYEPCAAPLSNELLFKFWYRRARGPCPPESQALPTPAGAN